MTEPRAQWPDGPEGYFGPRPLGWKWARTRLVAARNYWVATTSPDGRPRTRPVWGVWIDDTFLFTTGGQIARNVAANPAVTVHLESGDEVVVVDGLAEVHAAGVWVDRYAETYQPKYDWELSEGELAFGVIAVTPQVAFGWVTDAEGAGVFPNTATKWVF